MDIFGEVDESLPELEIFDRIPNPSEAEEAIRMYHSLRKENKGHSEAVDLAVKEVIPLRFLNLEDR